MQLLASRARLRTCAQPGSTEAHLCLDAFTLVRCHFSPPWTLHPLGEAPSHVKWAW
jgi:hypothetical protein